MIFNPHTHSQVHGCMHDNDEDDDWFLLTEMSIDDSIKSTGIKSSNPFPYILSSSADAYN